MSVSKTVSELVSHPVVIAVVAAFTVLYTSSIGPELPGYIKDMFNSPVFRFAVIFVVAYMWSSPTVTGTYFVWPPP